ncbi:hypothetical protein WDV06_14825 [Streptomyces racemochromogenes]|uniref:Integral membrane protein n=1 Tax=Streptomyces racemochromogenes TaxID=67353 RepID=A0ABW7PDD3_9ACTN
MSTLGVPQSMMAFLIGAQIAGAAGAVAFHLRVGDRKGASPAVVLTLASVALIVLRTATL